MADFVAVLKKTIDGLGETTPEVREKVYQKARATVGAKLAAINPPPAAVAERQRQALEDAIRKIEGDYAAKATAADPLAELDALFAELKPKAKAPPPPAPVPAQGGNTVKPADKPAASAAKTAARAEIPAPSADKPAAPRPAAPAMPADATPPAPIAAPAFPSPGPARTQPPAADAAWRVPAGDRSSDEMTGPEAYDHDAGEPDDLDAPLPPRKPARRSGMGLWLAVLALLIVIGGAGYGVYLNKDSFMALIGGGTQVAAVDPVAREESEAPTTTEAPAGEEAVVEEEPPIQEEPAPPRDLAAAEGAKFTQRLNPDGSEVDEGPAGGERSLGEGTSMAAATPAPDAGSPPSADALPETSAEGEPTEAPAAAEQPPAVAVGQKAIFYEERTSTAEGSADSGSIVWTLVQESPGADQPPEPVIRAEATIPDKGLQLRMTIRRNADDTLPASHIVELIFLTPDDFASGPIDNVLRMTMKETEQAAGSALIGIPAKIADGFFLVALSDGEREVQANTQMLQRQRWIDVPIVYKSGRRALITMEKGIPGEKVFEDALRAWQAASSG
jgi:hypothetical protein